MLLEMKEGSLKEVLLVEFPIDDHSEGSLEVSNCGEKSNRDNLLIINQK
jgi:hypothetical protein